MESSLYTGFCRPDVFFLFLSFCLFWDHAHIIWRSLARGLIGAGAASLHHNHSNAGSEPCLQPTPQLLAMLDLQPSEQGQGYAHGYYTQVCYHRDTMGTPTAVLKKLTSCR